MDPTDLRKAKTKLKSEDGVVRERRIRDVSFLEELKKLKDEYGSYDQLAKHLPEIKSKRKDTGGPTRLDRRKLKSLIEGGDVSLRISEIAAISDFLEEMSGVGLANKPFFKQKNLLEAVSFCREAIFFVGAYPRFPRRTDVSNWDLRSVTYLSTELNRFGLMPYEIKEVEYLAEPTKKQNQDFAWKKHVSGTHDAVFFSIASSKVCRMTEHMLSTMFSVSRPFETSNGKDIELPFQFVWPTRDAFIGSAFSIHPGTCEGLQPRDRKAMMRKSSTMMALSLFDVDDAFVVKRDTETWTTYGVICAQRREGNWWVVVSGLSGPATLGAARAINQFTGVLPDIGTADHSEVVWAVVEVLVKNVRYGTSSRKAPGDGREVLEQSIIRGPEQWFPPHSAYLA